MSKKVKCLDVGYPSPLSVLLYQENTVKELSGFYLHCLIRTNIHILYRLDKIKSKPTNSVIMPRKTCIQWCQRKGLPKVTCLNLYQLSLWLQGFAFWLVCYTLTAQSNQMKSEKQEITKETWQKMNGECLKGLSCLGFLLHRNLVAQESTPAEWLLQFQVITGGPSSGKPYDQLIINEPFRQKKVSFKRATPLSLNIYHERQSSVSIIYHVRRP